MTAEPVEDGSAGPSRAVIVLLGFGIGMLAAFLGIGGGVLIIPLLVFGFGLDSRRAAGTSLGVISVVVGTTMCYELLFGNVEAKPAFLAAALVMPTALFAATVAAGFAKRIPQRYLQRAFAVILFLAAFRLSGIGQAEGPSGFFEYSTLGFPEVLVLPVFGLLVGTVSALIGIGGGMLLIPGLGILFSDLVPLACRSTSLLVVFPTALVGFLKHRKQGTAVPKLALVLAPACALGAIAGSMVVKYFAADWFPKAFAIFMVCIGLRLVFMKPAVDASEAVEEAASGPNPK